LTNVVHRGKHHFDVFIGRPSKWGNPFSHTGFGAIRVSTREEAIHRYEQWVRSQPHLMASIKRELRGKTLGCYCKPLPCHGDVLARIAEEP